MVNSSLSLSALLVECLPVTDITLHTTSNAEQIDSRIERAIPACMMVDELMLLPVADRCVS